MDNSEAGVLGKKPVILKPQFQIQSKSSLPQKFEDLGSLKVTIATTQLKCRLSPNYIGSTPPTNSLTKCCYNLQA